MAGKKRKAAAPLTSTTSRKKQRTNDDETTVDEQPQQSTFSRPVTRSSTMGPPPKPAPKLTPKPAPKATRVQKPKLAPAEKPKPKKTYHFAGKEATLIGVGTDIDSAREDMESTEDRLTAASASDTKNTLASDASYNAMPPEVAEAFKRQEQRRNGTFKKVSFLAEEPRYEGEFKPVPFLGEQRPMGFSPVVSSRAVSPAMSMRDGGSPVKTRHRMASPAMTEFGGGSPDASERDDDDSPFTSELDKPSPTASERG